MRVRMLASAALIILSCAARADGYQVGPSIKPGPTGWKYQFTPYGWVPWVDGDATIKGRNFEVSETPVEVLETLDFA